MNNKSNDPAAVILRSVQGCIGSQSKLGFKLLKYIELLVPGRGLEPPRSYPLVPETSASTNSATRAGSIGMPVAGARNLRRGWGAVN